MRAPRYYFDHAATSPISPNLIEKYQSYLSEFAYNNSTVYEWGLNSKKQLEAIRSEFAQYLGVKSEYIFFTSGGTEGNNLALHHFSSQKQKGVIWSSQSSHPSLREPSRALCDKNWKVCDMPVSKFGAVDISKLDELPAPDIVSIEWVNNETGLIQPIEELSAYINNKHPNAHLIVDGVQGFAKLKLPNLSGVSAFSMSGHKIGAPVGVGALMLKDTRYHALQLGGGQESGFRSGTVAVPLISVMRDAWKSCVDNHNQLPNVDSLEIKPLRHQGAEYSPYIIILNTDPVDGEVLLHQLESEGIVVGLGSACSASKKKISETHRSIGLTEKSSRKTIRMSFDKNFNQEDAAKAFAIINQRYTECKKYF